MNSKLVFQGILAVIWAISSMYGMMASFPDKVNTKYIIK